MGGTDVMPAWSLVRAYRLSPTTLLLLLNAVIGTILLTSRSHRRRHHHPHGDDDDHHHQPQQHGQLYNDHQYAAPLARTSSVMERLRSLGLYRFRSGDFPPEYNYNLAANTVVDDGDSHKQQQQQPEYARSLSEPAARPPVGKTGNKQEKAAKAKVAKKPSVEVKKLERAPAPAQAWLVQRAPRAPARATLAPAQARLVERAPRAPARATVAAEPAAGSVDARADDFINKFREQLQLQRLNSLLNYKEMLNRGT